MNYIAIFCTCKEEEAKKIAGNLIEKRLIACASMLNVSSLFWWNGKVEEEKESLLIMKSREDKWENIRDSIKEMHSYEIPEIIAVPVKYGLDDYFKWVDKVVEEK
jgi:periplasmic divalent cation tolerance protein